MPKHHHVLRQRPRLVRENILNLPEIVDEIPRTRKRCLLVLLVHDIFIEEDEERLTRSHDLEGDVE